MQYKYVVFYSLYGSILT